MSLSRSATQEVYTKSIDRYGSFITSFQSPQGMRALLRRSQLLRAGLRVLDAGCGFGMATFALLFWSETLLCAYVSVPRLGRGTLYLVGRDSAWRSSRSVFDSR